MNLVIVPNILREAINTKLDSAIAACPGAESNRDILYHQLLSYFDEFGCLPEFTVAKKEAKDE